ncbi:MAG: hypothetical protein KA807_00350 [Prolixibacteraceae bacterium]|nr:hypothetical protein [Prolixibacteraceae bacterium]
MKKFSVILLMPLLASLFLSCEKNDENTQAAMIYISHRNDGMRGEGENYQRLDLENVYLYGSLIGSPLPSMNFFQIGSLKFSDSQYYHYSEGSIYFSPDNTVWEDQLDEPKFNTLSVTVNSSIGEIEGSVTFPDTIKTMSIDAADNIPIGTPVKVTWSGSNADYYVVQFYYQYMEDEYTILGYSNDTIVTSESVTFNGNLFNKDGELNYFSIYPMNGPLPSAGSKPNMKGVGYGYIYTQNESIESDRTIHVGNGIDEDLYLLLLSVKSAYVKEKPKMPLRFAKMLGIE